MATKPHGKARRRHCGPIQAAARKLKYQRQFARTAANKARHKAKAAIALERKLARYR